MFLDQVKFSLIRIFVFNKKKKNNKEGEKYIKNKKDKAR